MNASLLVLLMFSLFYLLERVGDFACVPILWILTGVEFICVLVFKTRLRMGVEAFAILIREVAVMVLLIWEGGCILDGQFFFKSITLTNQIIIILYHHLYRKSSKHQNIPY